MNDKLKKENEIYRSILTSLLCADGFLLIIYHISNGETNIVSAAFEYLYIGIPILIITIGFGLSLEQYENNLGIWLRRNWFAVIYVILRLISCFANDLVTDSRFWTSIAYETMFLVAINSATVRTSVIRIVFCMLAAFDLIAVSICSYNYFFLNDTMTTVAEAYPYVAQADLPFTLIFTNPNPAGMLAGLTASAGILLFRDSSKTVRLLLSFIIIINASFLVWSFSRTAMTGTAVILIIAVARRFLKKFNYKTVIASAMILCVGFMIPVYIMTLTADQKDQLQNSDTEIVLNDLSSSRYNLWKEHILSQKGHYVLGFGTASNAVRARTVYVKEVGSDEALEIDETHQTMGERSDLATHNGYLELILVAGLPAALLALIFLFKKILDMDNNFIDKHPVILLLIFLFWISVQESRFIVSGVRYMAFLMMLLLNWRDDGNEEEID